jgi:hypothetical protein
MGEEECADKGPVGRPAAALRVDLGTAWSGERRPENPEAVSDPASPGQRLPRDAADELPGGSPDRGDPRAAPAILDLRVGIRPIHDVSAEAGVGLAEAAPLAVPTVRPPSRDEAIAPATRKDGRFALMAALIACALIATAGWRLAGLPGACRVSDRGQIDMASRAVADAVAYRIVTAESNGDATASNPLSSATGAGQFLDGTWLDMIRAYRRDLAGLSDIDILALRHDPDISRQMVARFAEKNASVLVSRCMPVTAGTLYLSHFAGGAGAAAVLSAPAHADAAATMAKADSTGRTTREMIVTANPFLASFTVTDLRNWADRKMAGAVRLRVSRM